MGTKKSKNTLNFPQFFYKTWPSLLTIHITHYSNTYLLCSSSGIVGILQIIAGHCIDHAAATSLFSVDACLSWLFSHAIDYTTKDDWLGSYSLI